MRDVATAYKTASQSDQRTIGASMVFRKTLLSFEKQSIVDDYPATAAIIKSHDSDVYSGDFVRASLVELLDTSHDVAIQYVPDPSSPTWPTWMLVGDSVIDGSFPAVFENRVFYQDDAGEVFYADISTGTIGIPVSIFTATNRVWLAPISTSAFYYYDVITEELFYKEVAGTQRQFPGRLLGNSALYDDTTVPIGEWVGRSVVNSPYSVGMYAVRGDFGDGYDVDYIYLTAEGDHTAVEIKSFANGVTWSGTQPVFPLDSVDDDTRFDVTGAKAIDGKIFISGTLVRPSGLMMAAYSIGPNTFTMGRDMFITADDMVTPRPVDNTDIAISGGEMHLTAGDVWMLGPDSLYKATGTIMVGEDPAALKTTTSEINQLSVTSNVNAGHSLSLAVNLEHAAIISGAEAVLNFSINGEVEQYAAFDVGNILDQKEEEGSLRNLASISSAISRLSQWASDAYYDHWSQTKHRALLIDDGELIRVTGTWDITSALELTVLNQDGIAYSPTRASRGRMVRASFTPPAGGAVPRYGLFASYRQSTEWTDDISSITSNGIAAVFEAPSTLSIYTVVADVWTLYDTAALGLTLPVTKHWMEIIFQDGYLRVLYRDDTSATWVEKYADIYLDEVIDTFEDGGFGRGGVFVVNETVYANSYAVTHDATYIGVDDNSEFSVSDDLIINEERVAVTGLSPNILTAPNDLVWVDEVAPSSGSFTGYPICFDATARGDLSYTKDELDLMALVVTSGPGIGKAYEISDYDEWVGEDVVRVFVTEKPYSALGEGSLCDIVPAVGITRGFAGTTAASHANTIISLFADNFIVVNSFETYSMENDIPLAEMIRIVARRAGVQSVTSKVFNDTDFQILAPGSGWQPYANAGLYTHTPGGAISAHYDIIPEQVLDDNSLIIEIEPIPEDANETNLRLHIGMDTNADGISLSFESTELVLRDENGVITVLERFPHTPLETSQGVYLVSMSKGQLSVWGNRKLIHTFDLGDPEDIAFVLFPGTGMKLVSNKVGTTPYQGPFRHRWYRLDSRIDNFVMDMGNQGTQLVATLISERRVYLREGSRGELMAFRDRETVPDTYQLANAYGKTEDVANLITRGLIEGSHIVEALHKDGMKDYGNYFGLINSTAMNERRDLVEEIREVLRDGQMSLQTIGFTGAADIRIEAGDLTTVNIDTIPTLALVRGISFDMIVTDSDAIFDMNVDAIGHVAIVDSDMSIGEDDSFGE